MLGCTACLQVFGSRVNLRGHLTLCYGARCLRAQTYSKGPVLHKICCMRWLSKWQRQPMRCREPHINKTAVNMLGDRVSKDKLLQFERGLGNGHATWHHHLPREIPGKGLRVRMQGREPRGEHTRRGRAWGCHLPVTVSPIMAGGAENVHLNEVVLQCP